MRRVLVAGSSILVLAMAGFLAVGVGARTVAQAPVISGQEGPVAPAGTACYVSIQRCSQVPCVEFIGTTAYPALFLPRVARTDRCRPHLSGPQSHIVNQAGTGSSTIPPGYGMPSFQLALPALERKLLRRTP